MGWVVNSTPRRFTLWNESRYTFYKRLGGPQGRSEGARKISPPPEFDPRTVQPLMSLCNSYAIPVNFLVIDGRYNIDVLYRLNVS
jgi:hypothetical protein